MANRTYPQDHPYHKDAKAFIRGMRKRQQLVNAEENNSAKIIRLNRRLDNLKWGYWAINPKGSEEYFEIFPDSRKHYQD